MLLGEVKALSERTGWCTANNRHFSSWLHCSVPNVSMYITGLSKNGYLVVEYDDEKTKAGRKMQVNSIWYHGLQYDLTPLSQVEAPLSQIEGGLSQVEGPLSQIEAEIQYKDNLKPSVSVAHALAIPETIKAEKTLSNRGPGWRDYPKAQTPDELLAELQAIYKNNKEQWRATIEGTQAAKWSQTKTAEVVSRFCAWAIGEGWERKTFGQINARLKMWLIDEPRMGAKALPSSQATPQGPAYKPFNHL